MTQQVARMLGDRLIRYVGHVQAMLLGEPDQRIFQAQEIP